MKVAIIGKWHEPRCHKATIEVIEHLRQRSVGVVVEAHLRKHLGMEVTVDSGEAKDIVKEADLVLVLGGDGTLIGAARDIGEQDVPILAVNLGSLGFLTEVPVEELMATLDRCLHGDFEVTERMMLNAYLERDGHIIETHHVLNDVVIAKGALARIIDMKAFVDAEYLTMFKADGLIVSTPTGSTGYSLSANGPIIHPTLKCITVTPICPHTLTNRPIVLGDDSDITIRIDSEVDESVYLTLDGQVGIKLLTGDYIHIRASKNVTKIVKSRSNNYYEVLRTKLKWCER